MNQRTSGLLLSATFVLLSGCSDDDGANVQPKPPVVDAGTGGTGGSNGGTGGGGGSSGTPDASVGGSGGETPVDAGFAPCVPSTDAGTPASDAGDAGDAGDADVPAPAVVSFETQIYPVFRARCSPCHETDYAGGHNVASPDLNEAYGFSRNLSSVVLERVNGGGMPPSYAPAPNNCNGPLSAPGCVTVEEYDLIQRWVGQCYPR
ncbi:MAG TPA: hypothetical protein VJU61_07100 [Polyangiaceae bacterium]|nr:hypothetical protein [Polyangiaceae bacterium]